MRAFFKKQKRRGISIKRYEKRDQKNGFKDSKLYLNKYVAECDVWNEEKILDRAEKLYYRSIEIWKYPDCKNINIDDEKTIGLDEEDFNFTIVIY